jgi:hypothetical protein
VLGNTLELWCKHDSKQMDIVQVESHDDFPPNEYDPTDENHLLVISIKFTCKVCKACVVLCQEVHAPITNK